MSVRGRGWRPGRDKNAVRHPGRGGRLRPEPGAPTPRTVVVGGGIAGLAAATALAERGVAVTVLERAGQLGGRVRAWPVGDRSAAGPGRTMSRGFHAFFRQYYNLRGLLRRADPGLERLVPVADYPLVLDGGHRDSFSSIPRTPPLNLMGFVLTSPSFPLRDLARVDVPAALELVRVRFPDTFSAYDGESAAHFLDRLRFPSAARHLALEVFARSFFARPDEFAAGELVAMFHSYFAGSAEGLLFDVPDDDYDTALWAPLGRHLFELGADVRTGAEAVAVDGGATTDDPVRVALRDGSELTADAVVLAADPRTTRRLVTSSALGDPAWRERIGAGRNAPPFAVWRLWLDRFVDPSRPAFLGTSGYGALDNVSVLERFEEGARQWSAVHGGSVIELHAYAVGDTEGLRDHLRLHLGRIYPETTFAEVLHEEWLLQDDCPLVSPDPWRDRPEVATPDPRMVLAGDHIRCDYPVALMERAATTGLLAADQLLAGWGLAGHDLWTVPMQGIAAGRRRDADRLAATR